MFIDWQSWFTNSGRRTDDNREDLILSMNRKIALITGITGQDGSYLAEFLLQQGYEVHGLVRASFLEQIQHHSSRINHLQGQIHLHGSSLTTYSSLDKLIKNIKPDEIYHLAAQSYVSYAFDTEFDTINTNIMGTHNLLAVMRENCPYTKFFFAGSSEMFGHCEHSPQDEMTPFNPRSIYGISKLASYHLVKNYREQFALQASVGMMYNHESPRRGHQYVSRKISSFVAQLAKGRMSGPLKLGNLEAKRDWGYAPDYVEAMWLMLQKGINDDFVIATGKTNTVRDLLEIAFAEIGKSYQDFIEVDANFYRKEEKVILCGNPEKAKKYLDWRPRKDFASIIREMVQADLQIEHK